MLRVSKEQAGSLYKDKDTGQSVEHPIKGFSTAEGAAVCWLSLFIFFFWQAYLATLPLHQTHGLCIAIWTRKMLCCSDFAFNALKLALKQPRTWLFSCAHQLLARSTTSENPHRSHQRTSSIHSHTPFSLHQLAVCPQSTRWNGMEWTLKIITFHTQLWARALSTSSGCLRPHPAWPRAAPGMGHPPSTLSSTVCPGQLSFTAISQC